MKKKKLRDQIWFLQVLFIVFVLGLFFSGIYAAGRMFRPNVYNSLSFWVGLIVFMVSIAGIYWLHRKKDIRILLNS